MAEARTRRAGVTERFARKLDILPHAARFFPAICRKHYAALVPHEMADTVEFDVPARTAVLKRAEEA